MCTHTHGGHVVTCTYIRVFCWIVFVTCECDFCVVENVCLYNFCHLQHFNFDVPVLYNLKKIGRGRKNILWQITKLQHNNLISELPSVRCNHKSKIGGSKGSLFKKLNYYLESISKMWLERAHTWHKCSFAFHWCLGDPGWDKSWRWARLVSKHSSCWCQEINSFWVKTLAQSPGAAGAGCDSKLFAVIQSFSVPPRALRSWI